MPRRHRFESQSLQYLFDRHIKGTPRLEAVYEEELLNVRLARDLYMLRKKAKLSQAGLAKLAKTTTSVISRLENPDYRGHSLSMVSRIAEALGKRVEIAIVPKRATMQKGRTSNGRQRSSRLTTR